MIRELMLPPDTKTAKQSVEMLRGWIIDGHPQYVLFPTAWNDDLDSWGRFLADTARHIANAVSEDTGRDSEEILRTIKLAFALEIDDPINTHEGKFHDRNA